MDSKMETLCKDYAALSTLKPLESQVWNNFLKEWAELKYEIYQGPNSLMRQFHKNVDNDLDSQTTMLPPESKGLQGRKKKKQDHPEPILEENEDAGEEAQTTDVAAPLSSSTVSSSFAGDAQDMTVSTTTSSRPRRAATNAAEEKIKRMTEVSNRSKLRRPSDFNEHNHVSYNVYNLTTNVNQTVTINGCATEVLARAEPNENCVPRAKRRKGSGVNSTVVTSSNFFSSTMIHSSSPLHKAMTGLDNVRNLEMSMIPPPMDVDEIPSQSSRTRTLRSKKTDVVPVVKQEEIEVGVVVEEKSKENGQESSTGEESPIRTRTRTIKKPVNKIENLPEVRSSPKNIADKIREKMDLFENGGAVENNNSGDSCAEGRVTRTKARKINKTSEDEQVKAPAEFKVPLAVKNAKYPKKMVAGKKPAEKVKELPPDPKQVAALEKKRLREERIQKAQQAEKEKRENVLKLEKEREEKLKLKKQRDEKLKEEMEKRRIQQQAKVEQQRRECEAARTARLKELMEEEARKEAKRIKEQEIAERKAQAAQQANLAAKLRTAKANKAPAVPVEEEANYSISVEPLPSDDEAEEEAVAPRKPIPSWAKPFNRNLVLADQIFLSAMVVPFYENPSDFTPSITAIFGETIRLRPRTSSAVWETTVME